MKNEEESSITCFFHQIYSRYLSVLIHKDLFFLLVNNHWEPIYVLVLFPKEKIMNNIFVLFDLMVEFDTSD